MNANAKKWVKALRSGKYIQNRLGYLKASGGYCCLGVACELYNEKTKKKVALIRHRYLAPTVVKWLGLDNDKGRFYNGLPDEETNFEDSLAGMNDSGIGFNAIADFIEKEPKGLFK